MVDLGPLTPSRAWLLRLAEPDKPRVMCWLVSSHVRIDGVPYDIYCEPVALSPDDAGDLIDRPRATVELVERTVTLANMALSTWRIAALGFIEHEAVEAHEAAVDELRARIAAGEW